MIVWPSPGQTRNGARLLCPRVAVESHLLLFIERAQPQRCAGYCEPRCMLSLMLCMCVGGKTGSRSTLGRLSSSLPTMDGNVTKRDIKQQVELNIS